MKKIKADILIKGNLICKQTLMGGGKIYSCEKEKLNELFDVHNAAVIDGDVSVDNFNSKGYCVVVLGCVSTKGGGYEQ